MKKSRYIYFVFALLLIVAGYLVIKNRTGGTGWSAEGFSIRDTADIEFISIESGNRKVVLTKDGQTWQVNGQFAAGSEKIRGLLILLSRVKITGSVQSKANEDIRNALSQYGRKIIIGNSRKVIRSFIVYHDSVYSDYTFMKHENGNTIYRVEVPGVKYRNLAVLFKPDPVFWKSNILFQYRPEDIRYVHCYFPEEPGHSFRLVNNGTTPPGILSYRDSTLMENIDEKLVWRYLSYFLLVSVDEYLDGPEINLPDEFRGDVPDAQIRVIDSNNNTIDIDTYTVYYYDDQGGVHVNLDEAFLNINGSEWARIKYINLDPVVKQIDYFISD